MSVYHGDSLHNLQRAVQSNTIDQTLPPNQVVIVRDGPVDTEIQQYLDTLQTSMHEAFQSRDLPAPEVVVVPLPNNGGLAHALNVGLQHCSHELIARADSDDISLPRRFETMIPCIDSATAVSPNSTYDVAGSAIQEFHGDELRRGIIRRIPAGGAELRRYATLQSPLNHPSVVFRKSAVLRVGGYPEGVGRFEDYLLWEQLLLHNYRIRNLAVPLVLYRVDEGAYERRGGWRMLIAEIRLQRRFLHDRFITPAQFLRNVLIRAVYRLVPSSIRTAGYRLLKKQKQRLA
ncbi:glycosyl transferase family 2 [Bifidobacterium primatium]|uniref:Glycosyl transferase family 2 n=2 Tax=Bifidobacterium primatium TaxID=2045438 RepID=A0A2M9HC17_9BIFI|nr:glycosyl transferase family 2 [Bifidobacterium primatium]